MMSTAPPTNVTATSKRIIQKRWVCDVCKTKWFLDFDEACAHEAICTGDASSADNPKKPIADTKEKPDNKTKEVIEIADSTDSDVSPVKSNATRRSKRVRQDTFSNNAAVAAKSSVGTKQGGGTATTTPSFFKPKAKKSKVSGKKEVCVDNAVKKAPRKKKQMGSTIPDETTTTTKKLSKTDMIVVSKTDKSSGISQNFLAEHQTASFFAKRKQAQQEERERQKKREEARRLAKKTGEDGEADASTEKTTTMAGEDLGFYFPKFSHIIQGEEGIANIKTGNEKKGCSTLSYPHLKVDLADSTEEVTMPNLTFFGEDVPVDHVPDIYVIFSTVFESSKENKTTTNSTELWTDKHTISQIPSSILGLSNQKSADKLIKFIEDWKIRRHKSTLIKKSKSKQRKSKSGYDSDDSFLDDEGGGRTSLFLLTGPTGSGKSRLVHAISSSLDCVVMEINSGEVRGGGVLKRRVLESTQSHSSVALMRKREQNVSSLLGKVLKEKEFFDDETSSDEEEESSSLTVILIDEVDILFRDHGDTGFWHAISQLSQKAKSPIILTSTSMPPELLSGTFNFEHIELQRPTIEECCSKMEEVAKAEGILLKEEGKDHLSFVAEYFQCDVRRILNEMQLYSSMTHSACSSNRGIDIIPRSFRAKEIPDNDIEDERPMIHSIDPIKIPRECHSLITIKGTHFHHATLYLGGEICPHFSVVNDSTILAVCPPLNIPDGVFEGLVYKNSIFLDNQIKCYSSKFVDVVVRRRCSNGRVFDSSSYLNSQRFNWNIQYDASMELTMLDQKILMNKEEFISRAKAQRKKLENEANNGFLSSGEEMEFEDDTLQRPGVKRIIDDSSSDEEAGRDYVDDKCVAQPKVMDEDPHTLLEAALSEVTIEQPSKEVNQTKITDCLITQTELDLFAQELNRMSDVAFLEDTLLSLPLLSGAVEGLGSQSIDGVFHDSFPMDPSIDKLSKDSNHRPGFESLCLSSSNKDAFFYGDADAYMVWPCRQRERFLLMNSELHSRGFGALDSSTEPEPADKELLDIMENEELETSEFKVLSTKTKSEDDMMLPSQPLSTHMLSSAMLGNGRAQEISAIYHSNIKNTPWLNLRKDEIGLKVLETISYVLAPERSYEPDWNKISFGIRHSNRFNGMSYKGQFLIANSLIDETLVQDYMPYLRFIAFYENKMHLRSRGLLNNKEQRTRKSKRSKQSSCREHYLYELGGMHEDFQRDITELGDFYLVKD